MKRILLFALIIIGASVTVSAQINKGAVLVGGNVSFADGSRKTEGMQSSADGKITSYGINPSVGFAYKENRVWGIFGGISKTDYLNSAIASELTYGGGAFLRQYKPLGKEFYFFAEETAYFWYSREKASPVFQGNPTYKTYNTGLGITPGLAYGVSKKFQLELSLNNLLTINYANRKQESSNPGNTPVSIKESAFGMQSSLSGLGQLGYLNIGARFIIGKS
jgi:hypothetical protein